MKIYLGVLQVDTDYIRYDGVQDDGVGDSEAPEEEFCSKYEADDVTLNTLNIDDLLNISDEIPF